MGIEDLFERQWAGTIASLKAWWDTSTRHGCFCGAGGSCDEPIDGLDTCCQQHDLDYDAVGVSADRMWSWEGFERTVEADWALAGCAADADVDATHERANPDAEAYRERLIWVFSTRAQIGEWVRTVADAERNFRDWLDGAKDWVLSDAATPGEVLTGFAEHVNYLASLGLEPSDIGEVVRESGVEPSQFAADGFDTTAVA